MPPDEQSLTLAIQARDRAHEIVGQSVRDIERYGAALKQLKKDGDQTNDGNRRMGESIANLNAARARQREALQQLQPPTKQLSDAEEALRASVSAAAKELAGQAGAAGQVAASLGGVALAAAAVVGAVVGVTSAYLGASKAIGQFQEQQDLLADQLDLSQREIGALTLGAANVGRSFDQIQPSLFIFTRRLGEARAGSDDARRSFRALGIDPQKDLRSTGEILRAVGEELDKVGGKTERNRLLFDLFGRGSAAVLPVLRQNLGELADTAERTGITLSESAQRTAREADQAWDRLRASVKGLQNTILVSLAPVGTFLVDIFGKIAQAAAEAAHQTDEVDFSKLREQLKDTGVRADEARAKVKRLLEERGGFSEAELTTFGPREAAEGARQSQFTSARGVQGPSLPFGMDKPSAEMEARANAFWKGIAESAGKLTDEQQKQLDATEKSIALLELRHSLHVLSTDDERKALDTMRAQVASRQELKEIEERIAAIRARTMKEEIDRPSPSSLQEHGAQFLTLRQVREERARREAIESGRPEPGGWHLPGGAPTGPMKETATWEARQKAIEELQKAHQASISKTVAAVDQGVMALHDFAIGVASQGHSAVSALGQLISQILSIAGQLSHNSALGPIGALVGTVASFIGQHQAGGRVPVRLQTGATILRTMAPIYAQTGVVLSGTRNVDSEHALLGSGEAVLSHTDTDFFKSVLEQVQRALNRPAPATSAPGNSVSFGEGAIQINVKGGGRQDWRRIVNEEIMPEIQRASRLGTFSR